MTKKTMKTNSVNHPKANNSILLIILLFFSFHFTSAQYTISGSLVNASSLSCATFTGNNIINVGNGINQTILVMNSSLNLFNSCSLGPIQFVVKSGSFIDFSPGNDRLTLPAGSSIIFESGAGILEGSCTASERIYIGSELIASCNGGGGLSVVDFGELVANGGFNTVVVGITPSYQCSSGNFTITESVYPTPSSSTTYNWYSVPSGGTPFATQVSSSNPFSSTYTTSILSSTTTYYVSATSGSNTTPRRAVTLTIRPNNTVSVASATPTICINSTLSPITHSTTGATGIGAPTGLPIGVNASWASNTITISGTPTVSGTFSYSIPLTGGCGTATALGTITVNHNNTWTGILDTSWDNDSNWSCGKPTPSSTAPIIIPSGVPNNPLISTNISLINLTINDEAVLNVLNNGLTITGTLTLNGKIDLKNESQLVQTNGSNLIGDGIIEIDQQGYSDSYSYNYWSSPVVNNSTTNQYSISGVLRDACFPENIKTINFGSGYTYADTKETPTLSGPAIKLSTYWMYKYVNKKAGTYNQWTYLGNNGLLNPGEGFTLKGSNSRDSIQNYTFIGKPNNGPINMTINIENQSLIGNPYPSSIDAKAFIRDNIKQYTDEYGTTYGGNRTEDVIDGNLYFWDHYGFSTHLLKSYQGGYAIYNLAGGVAFSRSSVGGIPPPPGSGKRPERFIPIAQGFFVTAKDGGQIQFKNEHRYFKKEEIGEEGSIFIRSSNSKGTSRKEQNEVDKTPRIYLDYASPQGNFRQLLVAFIPTTTDNIDIGYDAKNIENLNEDLFWNVAGERLVIQAVSDYLNRTLPLVIKTSAVGTSKITLSSLENISAETDIYIRDKETGNLHNLRTSTFEVNLTAGIYTNRFELVLQPQKTLEINEENLIENIINIYLTNNNSVVFISNPSLLEIKEISVNNMIGQRLLFNNKNLDKNSIELPFNFESGVYVVTVKTNQGISTKKVLKY